MAHGVEGRRRSGRKTANALVDLRTHQPTWLQKPARKLKVLALGFIAFVLVGVPSAGIGLLAGALRFSSSTWSAFLLVVAAILPVILTPVLPCVFTLMYYDLRVRREAFDLELLSQQLSAG